MPKWIPSPIEQQWHQGKGGGMGHLPTQLEALPHPPTPVRRKIAKNQSFSANFCLLDATHKKIIPHEILVEQVGRMTRAYPGGLWGAWAPWFSKGHQKKKGKEERKEKGKGDKKGKDREIIMIRGAPFRCGMSPPPFFFCRDRAPQAKIMHQIPQITCKN